jgi:hypothetical protein
MIETIEKLSKEFFEKLGVGMDSLEVIEEVEGIFLIKVESKESSLLI